MSEQDPRRRLPGMDRLLQEAGERGWVERYGRTAVKRSLERALADLRADLARREGEADSSGDDAGDRQVGEAASRVMGQAAERLASGSRPSLRRVLNGTGVVLHTNLGRAPLAREAADAVREMSRGYANLEMELESGERGSRQAHCRALLDGLTGSEASLVVNNNAAAVSLAVHALAGSGEVLVSRGELVEIGGSFRIPEVIRGIGARPREVGTTNRTRLSDYREALGPETGALLKVHPSNYRVEGFTESVPLEDLVALGRERDVPVIHDLGSGLLRPELLEGFPPEPGPAASVAAGADVVTWSGDKLLGGPQAGIVNGRRQAVERMARDPLHRAFRVDKMTVAALEATLRIYRDRADEEQRLPALRGLLEDVGSVRRRAESCPRPYLPHGVELRVVETTAVVGGGAYPGHEIPSAGWELRGLDGHDLAGACRTGEPPLVGTVREGRFRVDFRTLLPAEEELVAEALEAALRRVIGGEDSRDGDGGRA